ncbi:MAG: hypothetical protein JRN08_09195 [Nitrososphaerota archaeon]|nr:hypothetical protein [Nitrososphaerota archaeon]
MMKVYLEDSTYQEFEELKHGKQVNSDDEMVRALMWVYRDRGEEIRKALG